MAFGSYLTLELTHADGRAVELDHDAGEELYNEVADIVDAYLAAHLQNPAEATMLDDIETGCVVTALCDDFAKGKLSFWFPQHWELGAAVAEHWYELAFAACRKELEVRLAARELFVRSAPDDIAALVRSRDDEPAFILIRDTLVGVYQSGELLTDRDGEPPLEDALTNADRERIEAVARSRQCQCQLCVELRAAS